MHPELEYWTADEVAECLGISRELQRKLWGILNDCENPTISGETPDTRLDLDNDDKAGHWWSSLTADEQNEINNAYEVYDAT